MNKISTLLTFALLIVLFSACSKKDDLDEWRELNKKAYEEIKNKQDYKALETKTGPTGVYYKVINSGTGTEYPIHTSRVKIRYKGSFYNGYVFDVGTGGNGIPKELDIQNTVRGFSFALQNMVVGDKWEIWIPYYLGYGIDGLYDNYSYQPIIKGYTTLVFEVELLGITQYPK